MDIMARDSDANVKKLGSVHWDGVKVVFEGLSSRLMEMLREIRVGGKTYKPDSRKYIDMLPLYLRGDRLWATVEHKASVKIRRGPS